MIVTKDTLLDVATAPRRNSAHWDTGDITWGEIIAWAETPGSQKEAGNYVLGELSGHRRSKQSIRSRCAITLDADSPVADFEDRVARELEGKAYLLHTTFSSTPEAPRYRVIVPTDRRMVPREYTVAAEALMQRIGEASFDAGSSQPERYMFKPAHPPGEVFTYHISQGEAVEVDQLVESWQGDLDTLPTPYIHHGKRDPLQLPGIPGLFNRAYQDLDELIEVFSLPYDRVGADRYVFQGAGGAAGMGPIADFPSLVFSHHSHDPAYGRAMSAFDLVRAHKFNDLDKGVADGTPVNRLPSYTAMVDFAREDPRVRAEKRSEVAADFEGISPESVADVESSTSHLTEAATRPDHGTAWLDDLTVGKSGQYEDTIRNWELIQDNDPVFAGMKYNALRREIEVESLPWREVRSQTAVLSPMDETLLAAHLERSYGIRPLEHRMQMLIARTCTQTEYHPVEDYLNGLEWDGVSRVETALPGVQATKFTRLVARKCLVAAVARMMEPGVKWDHMLMIYGTEGLGKSYWIERMSRGWSTSLGDIGLKDTKLELQRTWIATSDEGHSMKKADFDSLKEFLTQTYDMVRPPYAKNPVETARRFVVWGTTNDQQFLRRQEGNRRFLIVKAEKKVDFDRMTDEYVDQVWAEAVHLYRQGERLFLTDEEARLAALSREDFTQEDALSGLILEYLDAPVPEDWNEMGRTARMDWKLNWSSGMVVDPPSGRIDEVCSLQIWVEVLGNRLGDHRHSDLVGISNSLRDLPGWVQLPGQRYVPGYGHQVTYRRVGEAKDALEQDFEDLI